MSQLLSLPIARATDANGNPLSGAKLYLYQSGTTTPQSAYTSSALSVAHANPVVADAGGLFPAIFLDPDLSYRAILKTSADVTVIDLDPIDSDSAADISFTATATGTVSRDVQARLTESLSVLDFIPTSLHAAILAGTSTADVTSYVAAAITAAKLIEYGERRLVFPAGKYCVGQFDLTGVDRVVFEALGTVNISGNDGSQDWIFGSAVYSDGDPNNGGAPWVGDPPFNTGIVFTGGAWLIGPAAGQSYEQGWSIEGFTECRFERISISGEYGSAATGDRTAATIEISFLNTFLHCGFGNPGTPAATFTSWGLKNGTNNINGNTFDTCRVVGPGETTSSVGFGISSDANTFIGCDVSVVGTAFKLAAARSAQIINCYSERVGCVLDATSGLNQATVVSGGLFEVATNGTAIKAGSTQGLCVSGGLWKKAAGATGTTFINLGAACYGRSISNVEPSTGLEFDTWETGTEQGHDDLPSRTAEALTTSRVMFPATAVPSANANTLDDYQESAPTLGLKVGATAQTVVSAVVATKIGRVVTLTGTVTMNAAVSGTGSLVITGLPYAAAGVASTSPSLSTVTYSGTPSIETSAASTEAGLFQTTEAGTRSALTETSLAATSVIRFALTYTASE